MYDGTTHEPKPEDIIEWRCHLRKLKYLNPEVDCNSTTFSSMTGEQLSDALLNKTVVGKGRRIYHIQKRKGEVNDGEGAPLPYMCDRR